MIRKLNNQQRLSFKNSRMVSFGVAMLLTLFFTPTLRAQSNPVYSYSDYWGMNGFNTPPYLPDIQLQISKTGNLVSVSWPSWNTNAAVLQTTTNLSLGNNWTTLPNQPVESATYYTSGVYYARSMAVLPQFDRQFFRLTGVGTVRLPVFSFAIFYNDQLEFTQTAPLNVQGRVHANGPICLGAAAGNTLRFTKTVSTASSIVYSNMGGYSSFAMPIYEGTPTNITRTPLLRLVIGTSNAPAALREIINPPPPGEAPDSLMSQQRYYNKAALLILVSNTSVTLVVKDLGALTGTVTNISFNSASPTFLERTNLASILPFLSLTNRFYDYRESKWVMPTQIDMGVLKTWLLNTAVVTSRYPPGFGPRPTILYVADFRGITNLHAVRIANGAIIPINGYLSSPASGFTIATPNPFYIWGNYNLPNPAHAGTTNTTETFPASLVCDAITILSANWTDSGYGNGSTALSSRIASNTTINAAIIAGSVYSTGTAYGQWSGGVQNLPRLLESWTGQTLTVNGSLVNLYESAKANTQFQNPSVYYYPPTRNFNHDPNFNNVTKLPPGTPLVSGIIPPN